jgi:protein-tyrosine phosphatase
MPKLPVIEILFLCTGNICRSPVAEALLRERLREAGVDATVWSAGHLEAGNPASPHGVDLLAARGIDLSAHRSQGFTPEEIRRADLVIGMAREHVIDAVGQSREAWGKTFTLKELVKRGRAMGPRRAGEPLEAWLARVHAGRSAAELMRGGDLDVADPIGQPRRAYERMVSELEGLIDELFWLVWGEAEADGRQTAPHVWAS